MTQAPYQPMRKAQKAVTQEDMWSTLARHAKVEVRIHLEKAVEAPKEQRPPLEWCEPVKTGAISGYVLSRCGDFSISKDSVNGAPMYSAWDRRTKPMATLLGIRTARWEAEKLCEIANT
jgi:hypothetical protein